MITLTAPDGSKVNIDGSRVVRARRTVAGESDTAKSRIDWAITSFVLEPIDEIAPKVKAELASFTCLTSRDGSKIWFNAKSAVGPIAPTPDKLDGVVRSSIKLMNTQTYVTEDDAEVRAVIAAAGGSPLP